MIPFRVRWFVMSCVLAMVCGWGRAQMGAVGNGSAAASAGSSGATLTVTGRVISATTGQPVPRALVRLNDRSVLADHEGKFEFLQFSATTTNMLQVQKPGYYGASDMGGGASQLRLTADKLASPVEVRLYPEGLVTGTVSAPDGSALTGIQVLAMRMRFDQMTGQPNWVPAGQAISNSRGDFRLTVPPGDYRLETRYRNRGIGGQAVMGVQLPQESEDETSGSVHIGSGTEQHFELKPQVGPTYGVTIRLDGGGGDRGFPMILAQPGNGPAFAIGGGREGGPGEMRVELPTGSFTLMATSNGREGQLQYGETKVTVADHDVSGVELHMAPVAPIPVEVVVDSGATSDKTPPNASQVGLLLRRIGGGSNMMGGMTQAFVQQERSGTASIHVSPGIYRLYTMRGSNQWFVKEARYGTTDMLRNPITVAAGAGSTPIVVTVSDQMGALSGTVTLNGGPGWCTVYAIPADDGALVPTHSQTDGRYSFAHLQPGTYRIIAFEEPHEMNLHDPKVLDPYAGHEGSVVVTAGGKSVLDVNAVAETEVKP